ncbi:MAG: DNA polymerase III subunit delta [Polyangiales bacterium]|nr:DNA polymerase III subunit delta [Sandaracinaceae bacterium]
MSQSLPQVIAAARDGRFQPVHVIVGEETLLIERAIAGLRRAAVGDGIPGFNDDSFDGRGLDASVVVSAARTMPMMSDSRFVLVRNADALSAKDQETLASYVAAPCSSACLVLVAAKLDGRGKLSKVAKSSGFLNTAPVMKGAALRDFAVGEANTRGHTLAPDAAQALLDALGEDLSAIDDAVERLSLFVGPGQRIGMDAVEACVTRVRADSIWTLVDAISVKNTPLALGAASSLLADREPALRILAMVSRQLRMVAKMRQALGSGMSPEDAAREAGAPPFKARDLERAARRFTLPHLANAFSVVAETDGLLKGSRRPEDALLQEAVLRLCAA